MIRLSNIKISGLEGAIRGMRNPHNSWDKSDSYICPKDIDCKKCNTNLDSHYFDSSICYVLGENDYKLAESLVRAGNDHSKFLRQIFISIDITAPLYWWKEMDTYKVGTVANSESTMHSIHKQPFNIDMFSVDSKKLQNIYNSQLIPLLEEYRTQYLETKDMGIWLDIIQLLPTSFNQMRTWSANYQVLRNIYNARKDHKLKEWRNFCIALEFIPYGELITLPKTT
ncbi:MAG TPA: hypothetical protein PLX15_05000 [Candidatus Woesearchaeota archaeon]|nr:hypothetical protein [Candidatus Woesearchaeota archaeon]